MHPRLWNERALSRVGLLRTKESYEEVPSEAKKLMDKLRCVDLVRLMGSYMDVWVESYDN